MADYVDSIKIGEGVDTPIWDTKIKVNGVSPDISTHEIALPVDPKPDSESSNPISSKALYNLLINNVSSIAEYSVTLGSSEWTNQNTIEKTITNSIITANTVVIVSPSTSSSTNVTNYGKASIYCSGQSDNKLTFTCSTKPTTNISVNVLAINIRTSF